MSNEQLTINTNRYGVKRKEKERKMKGNIMLKTECRRARPHVNYTIGRDRNGNKTLRCSSVEGGSFAIQTNGNLPSTHRDGVTAETDAEVCAYVWGLGSERRRRILGI